MEINSDGIIVGGVCDIIHHRRAARERGAEIYLQTLVDKGCISSNNGWLRITYLPEIKEEEIYHIGAVHGSDVEIGYRRFRKDVIKILLQQNKSFRKGWLEKWLEDISSFEFGLEDISSFEFGAKRDNLLSILEGKCKVGYLPPYQDDLYRERKSRGEFTS